MRAEAFASLSFPYVTSSYVHIIHFNLSNKNTSIKKIVHEMPISLICKITCQNSKIPFKKKHLIETCRHLWPASTKCFPFILFIKLPFQLIQKLTVVLLISFKHYFDHPSLHMPGTIFLQTASFLPLRPPVLRFLPIFQDLQSSQRTAC